MTAVPLTWKKGRGKLGPLAPLLGKWRAEADSPMGKVVCTRTFEKVLGGAYIQLTAVWEVEGRDNYEEIALIGVGPDKNVHFWSFTSDKKQAQGTLADLSDIDPRAIGFEAEMPAGTGRMAYWPADDEGFRWVVEAKTKKGWSRFTEHHYRAV